MGRLGGVHLPQQERAPILWKVLRKLENSRRRQDLVGQSAGLQPGQGSTGLPSALTPTQVELVHKPVDHMAWAENSRDSSGLLQPPDPPVCSPGLSWLAAALLTGSGPGLNPTAQLSTSARFGGGSPQPWSDGVEASGG